MVLTLPVRLSQRPRSRCPTWQRPPRLLPDALPLPAPPAVHAGAPWRPRARQGHCLVLLGSESEGSDRRGPLSPLPPCLVPQGRASIWGETAARPTGRPLPADHAPTFPGRVLRVSVGLHAPWQLHGLREGRAVTEGSGTRSGGPWPGKRRGLLLRQRGCVRDLGRGSLVPAGVHGACPSSGPVPRRSARRASAGTGSVSSSGICVDGVCSLR